MISIAMPVYNEEKHIEEAILSILNQSYKDIEVIVADDQSTDNTYLILKKIEENDSRLKVLKNPIKGKVHALNYAVSHTSGDWLMIFAGDDILETGILEKWARASKGHNTYNEKIAFVSKIREFADGKQYNRFNGLVLPKEDVAVVMGSNYIMSKMIKEEMFPLPTGYPNEDGWTRLCFRFLNFECVFVPGISVNYRRHDGNSVKPNETFFIFNKAMHDRWKVNEEFLERYRGELSERHIIELENLILIEEQRYNGKTLRTLFANKCDFSHKIRNCVMSNAGLYRIKQRFEKFLLGRSMR